MNPRNESLDGVRGKRVDNKPSNLGMVLALVEEEGGGADHLLLALRVGRLEQISARHQHESCCFRPTKHHARAPQYVCFEYLPIPIVNYHVIERKRKNRKRDMYISIYSCTFFACRRRRCWGLCSIIEVFLRGKAIPLSLEVVLVSICASWCVFWRRCNTIEWLERVGCR